MALPAHAAQVLLRTSLTRRHPADRALRGHGERRRRGALPH